MRMAKAKLLPSLVSAVIPSVARDLGARGRESLIFEPPPTQVPRCSEDPKATAEAQRTQRSAETTEGLCVALRSLRLCGCLSFLSTGGRPQAGDAYARDDSLVAAPPPGLLIDAIHR